MALASGVRLGPYEIQSAVGAGGMGEVYRARDTRLDRVVALKILPAHLSENIEAKQRFDREARTISSLSHSNICHLYDVGSQDGIHFLVMEFLDGESLAERLKAGALPWPEVLRYGVEICEGLEKAHRSGVIHRDLKPGNIFLTREGHAKLLDFGLARNFGPTSDPLAPDDQTMASDLNLTSPGAAVGTVAYMSPEQARGERIDERSDLFSLGIVFYEMSTGRRPFDGATSALIFDAMLNRQADPPSQSNPQLPAELDSMIARLLAKDSRQRCQSVREVLDGLRELERTRQNLSSGKMRASRRIPSIAVLPFANLSADPENQYFSDGLSEELTNALSRLHGLQVASRTSAFRFRGADVDIREIGRQLNVESVLEGSVRRAGKRLRVTAQLIKVADGYQLWSERYDREINDIFEIQDEITESIVKMLEPTLAGEQSKLSRRHSENLQAYELYLKGLRLWEQRGESALRAALECFRSAVELDPEYALAHAGIADCYSILGVYGYGSLKDMGPRALSAVRKAMELEPSLGEVHYSMGNVMSIFGGKCTEAIPHLQRALEIQPRASYYHAYRALWLAPTAAAEEIAALAAKAVELDPLSPFIHGLTALALSSANQPREAVRSAARALELHPNFVIGLWSMHAAKRLLGDLQQSIEIGERLVSVSRRAAIFVGQLGLTCGLIGQKDRALALRQELEVRRESGEFITPVGFLAIDAGLDDEPAVQASLENYIQDGGRAFADALMMPDLFSRIDRYPSCGESMKKIHCYLSA